jgi:hypothetical protein
MFVAGVFGVQGGCKEAQPVAGDSGSHPPVDDTPIAGA